MCEEGIEGARLLRRLVPAIALLAVLVHLPSIDGRFVSWDDEWLIVENRHLDEFRDLGRILDPTAWRQELGAEYLPVRDLSLWVDRRLWDLNPVGFHLQVLLLFGILAALVLVVLRDLTGSTVAAAVGALLFAVHPVNVESVAWVSERKGLLAGIFLLLSLLVLRRTRGPLGFAGAVGLFVLAALGKSTVHFFSLFIFVLAWIDARRAGRSFRLGRAVLRVLPFAIVSAVAVWLNAHHQLKSGAEYGWGKASVTEAISIAGTAAGRSVMHLLVPTGLSAAYVVKPGVLGGAAAVLLAAAVVVVLFSVRRGGPFGPAAAWMVLAWLPVSNIVALPNRMADRYLLLPSIGLAGLVGLLVHRISHRPRLRLVGVLAVSLLLAVLSIRRGGVWSDSLTLWTDAVEKSPASGQARQNLGEALLESGRVDQAFAEFRKMVEVEPDRDAWWDYLATKQIHAGDLPGAEATLRAGLAHDPSFAGVRIRLATLLMKRSPEDPSVEREAEELLRGVARDPRQVSWRRAAAYLNLGTLHLRKGRLEKGIGLTRTALDVGLLPGFEVTALQHLVQACRDAGRLAEVRRYLVRLRALEEHLGAD
jgi:Tfp pilus assembly protein PilF